MRHPQGPVAQMVARHGELSVCTSIIVASELRCGAMKRGSLRLTLQLDTILGALDILPFEAPADSHYAELRLALERAGTPIGPNDMLVAAHARSLDLTVVTGNMREFSRVPMLSAVNWIKGSSS